MKIPLIYLSLFVISVSFASAQDDFRPGYIITLEHDTIHGEIEYRSNAKNYQSCIFKKDNSTKEYTPQQLIAYQYINDKYFTTGIVDGVFVEALVKGELSMYKYETFYYAQKVGDKVYKLESKDIQVRVNGETGIKEDTKWKGLIAYLIADCNPNPDPNFIKKINFGEKTLTKIAIRYNKCKGSGAAVETKVYKENKPWAIAEFGISAGVTNTAIKTEPINSYYASVFRYISDKYTSTNPSLGVTLGASFPRITEKFGLYSELYFTKSKYSELVSSGNSFRMEYNDTFIDLSTLSFLAALRYSLIESKQYSVQLLGGFSYDRHIKSDSKMITEVASEGNVQTTEAPAFLIRPGQGGYGGGLKVGRSFDKFKTSLLIKYFRMGSMETLAGLDTKTDKLSVSIILSK